MTFTKSANRENTYYVWSNGLLLGSVRKVARWTVRGDHIEWESYRRTKYLGSFQSRSKAGEALEFYNKQ